ncbi:MULTISPECIES: N-acyl homoserine lactonase family protein [Sodalis]|uniref:Glyoxylase-like metal-dependent hydrolase (Beta-lactamase superfamily II) n=1 Tax=Sodalis ligni TaxID=2697027 RepID=A0A4V2Q3N6_9GAMM|nr:N-acyl homoserine lactonase family protein [Sodalis ligni]TCL07428.1 glyoxylase-like metal-dependent hydrolase (beta-lactamase superfamily II) [Sodalis ligni]
MSLPLENYRIFAIKYAHHHRLARENFIGGDLHDGPMPIDYFVWAIIGGDHTYIVDTGFDGAMADRRGRTITHPVGEGVRRVGIDTETVTDVIITHMHYDHAGNHLLFPGALFHVQEREMAFCTGRCMCHGELRHPFAVEDVKAMVDKLFAGRVRFHHGDAELAPGLTLHRVGGHSDGLQIVRVHTERGWVVLASDAAHFFANIEQQRPYPVVYHIGDMLEGYATVNRLAASAEHVIPGHDPLVLERYPAMDGDTAGWIVRVDLSPLEVE